MNSSTAKSFAFPARNKLDAFERQANQARDAQLGAALADAIARGYAEGLARGRDEATAEAADLFESSSREGREHGHAVGLAEMTSAIDALRSALEEFNLDRAKVAAEADAFCVDLALAIVERIIATDKARADFARRATEAALKALAPAAPSAIYLNPYDLKCVGTTMSELPLKEDATLAPGTSRVEAGRLLVESSLDEAVAQVRGAVIEIKTKRITKARSAKAEKHDAV
jgi:flagellar biosynthesis/type III secretory pathway protein FliH